MASRGLAGSARGPDDYARGYGRVLSQLKQPALIHWLGEAFYAALRGYWGHVDLDGAMDSCLAIIRANKEKVEGLKLSLLDQKREIVMRARLPEGVRMLTGDDFDYPTTIGGDGTHHSDALLGAFDMIAPAASAAQRAFVYSGAINPANFARLYTKRVVTAWASSTCDAAASSALALRPAAAGSGCRSRWAPASASDPAFPPGSSPRQESASSCRRASERCRSAESADRPPRSG